MKTSVSWNGCIIGDDDLLPYLETSRDRGWAARANALIAQQRETWPLLAEGLTTLADIETRRVAVAESEVVVQHNPKRIRSTAAAVDQLSITERPCFLCSQNLPREEKGLAYGTQLGIFCNPFPVLGRHLTILHREHVPQTIRGNFEALLGLAADLAPDYFTLYNGPRCGASAPDHLHFQACSRDLLPIAAELMREMAGDPAHCDVCEATSPDRFELFTLEGIGRSTIVLRGGDPREISQWVYRIIEGLPPDKEPDTKTDPRTDPDADSRSGLELDSGSEPLLNLVCMYDRGIFTTFLFPRAKHRPASFFAEGDARLIVSPGAIDMAGVIVTPRHEDYVRLDGPKIESIFEEVSLKEAVVNDLLAELANAEERR